jgi:hypothetical protein
MFSFSGAKSVSAALEMNCAHVAQAVEHVLGKDEVTGSSPVVGLFFPEKRED